jgi:5-methylcytosine-specific restriction endonuclease McrA
MTAATQEAREKHRAYMREWRASNPDASRAIDCRRRVKDADKIKARGRSYYERNSEKIKKSSSRWSKANRDKKSVYRALRKLSHPDEHKAAVAKWAKENPLKIRSYQHNRRAKKAANGGTLSPHLASTLYLIQRGKCACCGKSLKNGYDMDHIVPLHLGGVNSDENIQLLTPSCNRQKGAKDPIEFMQLKRGMLL